MATQLSWAKSDVLVAIFDSRPKPRNVRLLCEAKAKAKAKATISCPRGSSRPRPRPRGLHLCFLLNYRKWQNVLTVSCSLWMVLQCAGRCSKLDSKSDDIKPTCPNNNNNNKTTVSPSTETQPALRSGHLAFATVGVLVAIFLLMLIITVMYNVRHVRHSIANKNNTLYPPGGTFFLSGFYSFCLRLLILYCLSLWRINVRICILYCAR